MFKRKHSRAGDTGGGVQTASGGCRVGEGIKLPGVGRRNLYIVHYC